MTPEQFRQWLTYHGLTVAAFAAEIGVCPRTVYAWQGGKTRVPNPIVKLCELWGWALHYAQQADGSNLP